MAPDAPEGLRRRRGVLIGSKLARPLEVDLGSKVRLDTTSFNGGTAAAFYVTEILHVGSDVMDKSLVTVRLKALQDVSGTGDLIHEAMVVVNDEVSVEDVVRRVKMAIAAVNQDGALGDPDVQPWWKMSPDMKRIFDLGDTWNGIMTLAILSAGVLITMFMVAYEHTRDFGVRLALAASPASLKRASPSCSVRTTPWS